MLAKQSVDYFSLVFSFKLDFLLLNPVCSYFLLLSLIVCIWLVELLHSKDSIDSKASHGRLRCSAVSVATKECWSHTPCGESRADARNLFHLATAHETTRKCTSVFSVFGLYTLLILWTGIAVTHKTCIQELRGSNLDRVVDSAECGFFVAFSRSRRQMVGQHID